MYNTQKLEFSYKKLILNITGFYLIAGFCLYLTIQVFYHPHNGLLSLMGLVSNSLLLSNQVFSLGAWLLIGCLSMILLPSIPVMVAKKLRVLHLVYPDSGPEGHIIDLITGQNDLGNETISDQPLKTGKHGIVSGNKGMIMVADGKVMFVNKEFCQLTGYSPVEVIGKDFVEFLKPGDLPKYAMLIRTPQNEPPSIHGMGLVNPNQRNLDVYIAGNKNSISNPNDICLFYVKEASSLEKTEINAGGLMMNSIEEMNSCFWMWDEQGLIHINANCRKLVPVSLGLLMRKPRFMLKALSHEQRKAISVAYDKYLTTHVFDEEVRILFEDGSIHWFRVMITPCHGNNGETSHHTGIATEITSQKKRLDEIETSCEQAITANYNKTAFLANMSHEIRSPLNGILGFSELLVDPDLNLIDRERYIDIIKNNGNALLTILTDIIDISKLESGKMKIVEKEFLPAELMRELQLQFSNDPLATHKGLTLKWLISDDIAGAKLISDPYRFRQILVNLITNALKYSNKGRIEVAAERWDDRAVFWIKDTGIGIPEDSLPFIFDRYRQVAKADSSNVNGFGLGLAISKALVELLGGNIWAESKSGQGSVFYFTIPYKTPKLTEMNNVNSPETAFPYDWKGRTILIAEDIDFSFLYIEAVLRRTGAKVLWAQNGREAIEMVKVNPGIDIALMDIHMPIMNGYDATREIMKIRPDLPVIAQTAFVLPDDVKACYAAGCAGYLAKPIRREQLLNTLTDYFEKIDQNAQVQAGNMPVYRSKIS